MGVLHTIQSTNFINNTPWDLHPLNLGGQVEQGIFAPRMAVQIFPSRHCSLMQANMMFLFGRHTRSIFFVLFCFLCVPPFFSFFWDAHFFNVFCIIFCVRPFFLNFGTYIQVHRMNPPPPWEAKAV